MKTTIFVLLLVFVAHPSWGQVYRWVDEKGITHLTDDITTVPQGQRYDTDKIGGVSGGQSGAPGTAQPGTRTAQPAKDRMGRGEEYWKALVEQWKKRLTASQEKIEVLRVKYNEVTERFNDSRSTAQRGVLRRDRDEIKREMDQHRIQIEEAKEMLDKKIPEEARFYDAKPEWIRP